MTIERLLRDYQVTLNSVVGTLFLSLLYSATRHRDAKIYSELVGLRLLYIVMPIMKFCYAVVLMCARPVPGCVHFLNKK